MKNHKFRQFNKNNGQFHYWGMSGPCWDHPKRTQNYVLPQDSDQFTGKRDMDGKPIYEGDILELVKPLDPEGTCFDEKLGERMSVDWDNESSWYLILGGGSRSKIIGNVHKNTELLEEDNNENT